MESADALVRLTASDTVPSARDEFIAGFKLSLGVMLSYLPFGMVCGVAAIQAGMTDAAALAMPLLVFGGSSQVVVNQLLVAKAPLWVVIVSGLIVNLRFMIYSAALARHARNAPFRDRLLFATFIVDHTYAFTEQRARQKPKPAHLLAYYLGTSAVIWPSWVLFNAMGVYLGLMIPASWQLEFTVPLAFITLVAPGRLIITLQTSSRRSTRTSGAVASALISPPRATLRER